MVLKSPSVLSFLLSPRLGVGSNQKADKSSRPRKLEKPAHHRDTQTGTQSQGQLSEQDVDPFRLDQGVVVNPLHSSQDPYRAHSTPTPTRLQPPAIVIPDGGVGESPKPANRSTLRHSRSSFTGFFAFSSRRKSAHGPPIIQFQQEHLIPPAPVPGKWQPGRIQTEAHAIDRSNLPSPLRADDEDYYYSYYASLTPTIQSSPASPQQAQANIFPSDPLSLRPQEFVGNQDLDSQNSSPVDRHPPHTQFSHPYAYSSPLPTSAFESHPGHPLRDAASEQMQHGADTQSSSRLMHSRLPPSAASHDVARSQSPLAQPPLKTSISTPNLPSSAPGPSRPRSIKKPFGSKMERWLSAETWWDALLSPSPRFKVKQVPGQDREAGKHTRTPTVPHVDTEIRKDLGASSPPVRTPRPRAASSASHARPVRPALTKSRSTADLLDRPSTSALPSSSFEPELEPLPDEPTPTAEQNPTGDSELALPEPPLSLAQVIDEGEALDQQRAQWKLQASKSIGNKHARSLSRARSKSLSERHVRGRYVSDSSKSQTHLEFLAARTLLGSQSTMPTLHVTKPSGSSTLSKPISHTHSQSAFSYTHTHASHSHSHTYSHSHSHSLTTSNSSKSSRYPTHRGHSRNESWGKTALLKAGALCGVGTDDSHSDDRVPSSSKADIPTAYLGEPAEVDRTADEANGSPSVPSGEVGIAISSPPPEESLDLSIPDHPYSTGIPRMDVSENVQEDTHRVSKHTHKSSEYAGPHPSVLELNLPQRAMVNDVSMRHRLPPRAVVHLPIGPLPHPYASASASTSASVHTTERRQRSGSTTLQLPARSGTEQSAERSFLPHISLSQADFERFGVGEALVYASLPQPEDVLREQEGSTKQASSPVVEHPPLPPSPPLRPAPRPAPLSLEKPPPVDVVVEAPDDSEQLAPSPLGGPPSLTASTIQMVMSAFDNPDDLDEFQDLFYKPQPSTLTADPQSPLQVPVGVQIHTDVRNSESNSPLENLVRSLSEEMRDVREGSRTPSDRGHGRERLQSSQAEDHVPSEDSAGTNYVFMDLTREYTSSSALMEPGTPMQVPIQKESERAHQPSSSIPEDVTSSCASSVLGSALELENENDTFGYPIWRNHLRAVTAPAPTPTSRHSSVQPQLSVVDTTLDQDRAEVAEPEEPEALSPVTARSGLSTADAVRSSYMTTTSDISRMSGLSDFPLPPSARPGGHHGHVSILQAYFEGNSFESDEPSPHRPISTDESHYEDDDEDDEGDYEERLNRRVDDDDDWDRYRHRHEHDPEEDEDETSSVSGSAVRVKSYESHRTTFGGIEDMDLITRLHHNVGP